MPGNWN